MSFAAVGAVQGPVNGLQYMSGLDFQDPRKKSQRLQYLFKHKPISSAEAWGHMRCNNTTLQRRLTPHYPRKTDAMRKAKQHATCARLCSHTLLQAVAVELTQASRFFVESGYGRIMFGTSKLHD